MGKYYVFSDESGHWSQDGYYVRSWVILSNHNFKELKRLIADFKQNYNIKKELKYKKIHDYSCFNELDFDVYFTLTKTKDFHDKEFKIISYLNNQDNSFFKINNKNIKNNIVNSIKNSIFFNIYEYYHIQNVINYIDFKYRRHNFEFVIDSPQSVKKQWVKMFNELKPNDNYMLKIERNSENSEGIQFADILAGNLKKIIKNSSKKQVPYNIFDCKIITNFDFYISENKFMNNPQMIMWDDSHSR